MPTSEAMATMIQLNLTVRAYNTLREKSLKNGGKTFPPYKEVQKLRETCKPSNIIYRADEIIATIQDTRDHQHYYFFFNSFHENGFFSFEE